MVFHKSVIGLAFFLAFMHNVVPHEHHQELSHETPISHSDPLDDLFHLDLGEDHLSHWQAPRAPLYSPLAIGAAAFLSAPFSLAIEYHRPQRQETLPRPPRLRGQSLRAPPMQA